MRPEIIIRRARPEENSSVHELVQVIADETFADLFPTLPVPIGEANWISAWLAISDDEVVGVTMTQGEWVSDFGSDVTAEERESEQGCWRTRRAK